MNIQIQTEYGKNRIVSEEQFALWLEDIFEEHEEIMSQPLTVGNPFAFCAPEIIRGAVTTYILREKLQNTES